MNRIRSASVFLFGAKNIIGRVNKRWRPLVWLMKLLGLFVALVGLYGLTAWALVLRPVQSVLADQPPTVEAYVLSNGVHTDLVLPVRSSAIDWHDVFPLKDFRAPPPDAGFIAIGWGDREFYLNTPTWADLTASRALGALFGRNSALVHVSYLQRAQLGRGTYTLPLSQAQYAKLVDHVRASLPQGPAVRIANAHYDNQDAFYEALGGYSMFETCNTWTGRALRSAGVSTSRWTPFDFTVTWHLQLAH